MTTAKHNNDWGFPRWRSYGAGNAAQALRPCDRHGCDGVGDRPAPKAPNRPERWYFCEKHAAEYNADWDYFRGLSPEEAAARAESEKGETRFAQAGHWQWGGPGDGSRSRAEMDALAVLGCDPDADLAAIKEAHRKAVKANHPDAAPGDARAAERFRAAQTAFEVLERASLVHKS